MATTNINLCSVLYESKRIINAHSRHFLALSVLFLLPLSFSITVYPAVQRLLLSFGPSHETISLLAQTLGEESSGHSTGSILLAFGFTVFVTVCSLLAVGSITYSVFQGFYGRPVKLWPAIKSGFNSFLPLFATVVVADFIISGIVLILGFFLILGIKGIELAGFQVEYSSAYVLAIGAVFSILVVLISLILQVNWNLASVIVVVESVWGFLPLKRSRGLVRGMRRVTLSLIIFFGLFSALPLLTSSYAMAARFSKLNEDEDTIWWMDFVFLSQIVATTTALMLLILYSIASNTVLYMYCKAIHGELACEIAEEFAREYVSLPFDDGKVPHVVSVAHTV